MAPKNIFILGGYGGTGRVVCRRLLQHTDAHIVIGGRNLEKAETVAVDLRQDFGPERIRVARADASDYDGLVEALAGCDLLLVASATPQYVSTVARAALAAKCDYLDYHFNNEVPKNLETMRHDIEAGGRCFITQAGFHPGLPAAFARHVAAYFTRYREAYIGMIMNAPIENPDSIYELVDELQRPTGEVYREGKWKKSTWRDGHVFNLGRFGARQCFPIKMAEMEQLPPMLGLEKAGAYIAGFNWFTDYLVFPLCLFIGRIKRGLFRRPLAHLLAWGINRFPGKETGVVFVLEASGEKDGQRRQVRVEADHADAYDFTAIAVVACVKQYLFGRINKPGVWLMGQIVEPAQLFDDMKSMGVNIRVLTT